MTEISELLRATKKVRDASDQLERLALLREVEKIATEVRRTALVAAIEAHGAPAVARKLGISTAAVYYQAQHASEKRSTKR